MALTETWLRGDPSDAQRIGEVTPAGYHFHHKPRLNRKGGGVGILLKKALKIKLLPSPNAVSFEHMVCDITTGKTALRMVIIYRPPASKVNKSTPASFLTEFYTLLERLLTFPGHLIITGDFNFHVDVPDNPHAIKLLDTLDSVGLVQLVTGSTHRAGHTLDLVITRADKPLVDEITLTDPLISDHLAILFSARLPKPPLHRKTITSRKIRSINHDKFIHDIESSGLLTSTTIDTDNITEVYFKSLNDILDKHAPLKTSTVTVRQGCGWFTDQLRTQKRGLRKLEETKTRSGLTVDCQIYEAATTSYRKARNRAKRDYYTSAIIDASGDQGKLFRVADKLLHNNSDPTLPTHDLPGDLANDFITFFNEKVSKIQSSLITPDPSQVNLPPEPVAHSTLSEFAVLTSKQVYDLIMNAPIKSSALDPIPADLFRSCLPALLPVLTAIVNHSLQTGTFPDNLKQAQLSPIIKKFNLDPESLNNYRPISNLSFISKLVERAVAKQLTAYMADNNLFEPYQSAYRSDHSTETALLCVMDSLLVALDNRSHVFVSLLDCSAAFDLVVHDTLLKRMSARLGVSGVAYDWFKSYLSNRAQCVSISGHKSNSHPLDCGVPQGSVLGPILFTVYTLPLGDIIRAHSTGYHLYADDTQLFLTCNKPLCPDSAQQTLKQLEACIAVIRQWMPQNGLKLNDSKTEYLLLHSKHLAKPTPTSINIGDEAIPPSHSAKNLGVIFDDTLSLKPHVASICKAAFYQLRRISRIRRFITLPAAKTLVHSFVSSRLDYCNSVLSGLPNCDIQKLQCVQNAAARLVTHSKKYDHITPVLADLHWLPVRYRILFKVLVLTYRALEGTAPPYIQSLLSQHTPKRALRSAAKFSLTVPRSNTISYGARAFSRFAPAEFNKLPESLTKSATLSAFKSGLKTHLFCLAYN